MAIAAAQAIIFTFNVCVKTTRNPKSSTTRAPAAAVANAARPATTAASALPIWPRLPLGCCFSSSWWCNRRHCCCAAALRLPRRKRTSSAVSPVHRSSSNQQVFLSGRSVGSAASPVPADCPSHVPSKRHSMRLSLSLSLSRHAPCGDRSLHAHLRFGLLLWSLLFLGEWCRAIDREPRDLLAPPSDRKPSLPQLRIWDLPFFILC